MDKDSSLKLLRSGACNIVFTKVDGSAREMNCTLLEELLPASSRPSEEKTPPPRKENPDVQRVFDLGIQEWRSFRWDLLQSVEKSA